MKFVKHEKIPVDWTVRAKKGLLKHLLFLWAMRTGEESLKLELLRRREGEDG